MLIEFTLKESNRTKKHYIQKIENILKQVNNKNIIIRFTNKENSLEINPDYKWNTTPAGLYFFLLNHNEKKEMYDLLRLMAKTEYSERLTGKHFDHPAVVQTDIDKRLWYYSSKFMTIGFINDMNKMIYIDDKNINDSTDSFNKNIKDLYYIYKDIIETNSDFKLDFLKLINKRKNTFDDLMMIFKYIQNLTKNKDSFGKCLKEIGYDGIIHNLKFERDSRLSTLENENIYGGFMNEILIFDPNVVTITYKGSNLFMEANNLLVNTREDRDRSERDMFKYSSEEYEENEEDEDEEN